MSAGGRVPGNWDEATLRTQAFFGAVVFGAALAAFFGAALAFFLSLPCALLPFAMILTSL